jgi:hypothetical protein
MIELPFLRHAGMKAGTYRQVSDSYATLLSAWLTTLSQY